MASESNEKLKRVCFWFWLTYTPFFIKDELTKLHLLCDLLGKKIIISNKMNTFFNRADFALSNNIFIFIVWWVFF